MKFTKMHGCGNDYIYINCLEEKLTNRAMLAAQLSNRNFGIGSDGLICIDPSDVADFKMDMYNADGSQGIMCGNGIRCVGKYVFDYGLTDQQIVTVETICGIKTLYLNVNNHKVTSVRVCMGEPNFSAKQIPVNLDCENAVMFPLRIEGKVYEVTCVSMGNPHAVIFVDSVDCLPLEQIGPLFENHPIFPNRVNTEFIEILPDGNLKMRVWERGSGETLACGTGACAALAAAFVCGKTDRKATVFVRGGALDIHWNSEDNKIYMTGPAVTVYDGIIEIQ